jgi:hypothetical protein
LLGVFVEELNYSDQHADAEKNRRLAEDLWTGEAEFVKIVPIGMQVDQSIATE